MSAQRDFWFGLDICMDDRGRPFLRGPVKTACKVMGITRQRLHQLCEDGTIRSTQAATNRKGGARGCKRHVYFEDVFRLTYGEERAKELLADLGLN